ncbi:uncharacterized protein LOC119554421 [Drosophila subpulchrella]|uniref:uncharacterized protein LOC119554421 n=1 Tax=Drosophila subpulchrella TaxID=1486046 RepID=UPI0018A194DD|nr:uncharacterized protein LOC119554421 [Drosophila subpulchrella]
MSFKCIYFFIIFGNNFLTAYTQNESNVDPYTTFDLKTGRCLDCTEENKLQCRIEDTGYSCYEGKMLRRQENSRDDFPKTTSDLDVCIPPGMKIKNKKAKICCVWSPNTGCQILLAKDHPGESCFTCRVKYKLEYNTLKSCPCIENEGTVHCFGISWHFYIFTYFLTKLFSR